VQAPPRAHVELCGALVVQIGGRRIDAALPGRKGRMLFACLVINRQRAMSRDELIDVIWPQDPPVDPDGAFATLLTRLRTALGHDLVRGRSELTLALGDDAWIDWEIARDAVGAAETLLAGGDASGALELAASALEIARRPILPGVSTQWIEDRRRELIEARAALLETYGRAALTLGGEHLPVAERSARELIEIEPYRESAHALLMETHAARGNVAEALRAFDALRSLLREELGMTPSQPLSDLAGRLLEQEPPRAASGTAIAPESCPQVALPPVLAAATERQLVGRRAELHRLLADVQEPRERSFRVVAVTGDAGIGKSRLAAEVAARAHAGGCDVLHGSSQRHGVTSYQPFVEALRRRLAASDAVARGLASMLGPELAELSRVVPELRRAVGASPDSDDVDTDVRRQRTFCAVGALCEEMARSRPLLLVLEDLQWADAPTLLLLRHVVHALRGVRATILVTIADDEQLSQDVRALLLDLLRDRALDRLVLRGLDEGEIAELMTSQCRGPVDHAGVRRALEQTGGNPFLVEELVRSEVADDDVSARVRDCVELRLDGLDATARGVLEIAAAIGLDFDVFSLARRAGISLAEAREAVRHAVDNGIIVRDKGLPERFAFRNGLVRGVLLASIVDNSAGRASLPALAAAPAH